MCFSQEMSAGFSVAGALFAFWIMKTNGNKHLFKGVVYFVLMEILQVVQYSVIARDIDPDDPTLSAMEKSPQCQSSMNRFLTFLGLVHIAFQVRQIFAHTNTQHILTCLLPSSLVENGASLCFASPRSSPNNP